MLRAGAGFERTCASLRDTGTAVASPTAQTRGATMLQEFKAFAMRGNVIDLAVGVIIGAAFGKIVDALVNDIVMPIVGIVGKADFTNYFVPLSGAVTATNLADAKKQGGVLAYGDFITIVVNFLIVAIALFFVVRGINAMMKTPAPEPAAPPPPSPEVKLLTEIRDHLAKPRTA
jgi:large conductance mechanosensitive channel